MNKKEVKPLIMKPAEAQRLLGLSQHTIWKMCRRGDLPVIEVGERVFILREPFLKMFQTRSTTA